MARFDKLEFGPSKEPAGHHVPIVGGGPDGRADRDADYWIERADDGRRAGLYELALTYYSRALELDKSLISGWLGQVQMLILLSEFKEAELWARKSLELFPKNGDLLAGRAQALCRLADFKSAFAVCDAALGESGQSGYRWLVRGEIMVARNEETAGACFDKAQQFDPDWLVPLEIAQIYLYYRMPAKALSRARRAVEAATDRAYAWYVQGLCESGVGLNSAAVNSLRHCLQLTPRHAGAEDKLRDIAGEWFGQRWWRRLFG
jgi:tetratricopeptide (TPR) repeat protein